MLYIQYDEAKSQLEKVLLSINCPPEKAKKLSEIFADNSLEGVYSHGINRFPRFISTIKDGLVNMNVEAEKVSGIGGLEVWDGNLGIGPLNAEKCMNRAIDLAKVHGIGCVSIRNSNHWMRAGRYGWQAANSGMIGLCWTNGLNNMPTWGATDPRLGNNPIVMAVPRKSGNIVLDMAMSQFAYGKLEVAALNNEMLPFDGGFDSKGNLTKDPKEILKTQRILPAGYWKGSSMTMLLDLIASGICLGRSTYAISQSDTYEAGVSQIFIAINFRALVDEQKADSLFDDTVNYVLDSKAIEGSKIRYPGQSVAHYRENNLKNGIPINEKTWNTILGYLK